MTETPQTEAGRALLEALSTLAADLPLEFGDEPLERLDIEATMQLIVAIEHQAEESGAARQASADWATAAKREATPTERLARGLRTNYGNAFPNAREADWISDAGYLLEYARLASEVGE
jgi:hypothetical protein